MSNNQGIYHLNIAGRVACKNDKAHLYIEVEQFTAHTGLRCKRCVAKLAKIRDNAAKRNARLAAKHAALALVADNGHILNKLMGAGS